MQQLKKELYLYQSPCSSLVRAAEKELSAVYMVLHLEGQNAVFRVTCGWALRFLEVNCYERFQMTLALKQGSSHSK